MPAIEGDRALLKAKDDAINLLEQRQRDLTQWNRDTEENFLAWFGTTDEKARAIIAKRIAKAIAKLRRLTLLDFVAIPAPRKKGLTARQYQRALEDYESSFAFVYAGSKDNGRYELTVHIGPEFASADEVTRAGTLVHEVSHFVSVGDTDDVSETFVGDPRPKDQREMYGYTKAERLSMKNVREALKNADNFEFFIEHHDPADHDLDLDGAGDFPGQSSGPSRG
jgi:Lysine-specific metallo-endopeptidase